MKIAINIANTIMAADAPMTEPIIGAGEATSEPIANAASVEVDAPMEGDVI